MSELIHIHESIGWAKTRLDELDAIITEANKTTDELSASVRHEANVALGRLLAAREKLQKHYERLRAIEEVLLHMTAEATDLFQEEWIDVESALQALQSASKNQTNTLSELIGARLKAQREAWEASASTLRDRVAKTIETAHSDFDAAARRLSDEVERFQSRVGGAKDESWKALKSGLADAKAVHDRTIRKVKDALSKLR
jgi:hypothetical protein